QPLPGGDLPDGFTGGAADHGEVRSEAPPVAAVERPCDDGAVPVRVFPALGIEPLLALEGAAGLCDAELDVLDLRAGLEEPSLERRVEQWRQVVHAAVDRWAGRGHQEPP